PEQRQFLEQALAYYQEMIGEQAPDPDGQARQARAYFRIGALQQRLGWQTEAEAAYRAALEQFAHLAAEHPQTPEYRRHLAQTYNTRAYLLKDIGNWTEPEPPYRAALHDQDRRVGENPLPESRLALPDPRLHLGILLKDQGKPQDAEAEYRA